MKVLICYDQFFEDPIMLSIYKIRYGKVFELESSDDIMKTFNRYNYYPHEYLGSGKKLLRKEMLWYLPENGECFF